MVKTKRIRQKVQLVDLPDGTLFIDDDGVIGLKTEYLTTQGAIQAYIVGTGEFYSGGVEAWEEQRHLQVTPLGDAEWLKKVTATYKED